MANPTRHPSSPNPNPSHQSSHPSQQQPQPSTQPRQRSRFLNPNLSRRPPATSSATSRHPSTSSSLPHPQSQTHTTRSTTTTTRPRPAPTTTHETIPTLFTPAAAAANRHHQTAFHEDPADMFAAEEEEIDRDEIISREAYARGRGNGGFEVDKRLLMGRGGGGEGDGEEGEEDGLTDPPDQDAVLAEEDQKNIAAYHANGGLEGFEIEDYQAMLKRSLKRKLASLESDRWMFEGDGTIGLR
ncbi:hypothetical protein K402DRAFT_464022 [Aulographum hederae CBS 113979]|uniref:Uncharacterized protein n=1 Tax=Aulographum hederae CBS 113979 TaxID=1176131 RepID=A0A6G1GZ85_9PEZI|nr:hypothetical protein K402DRAFT_464022 [Aulographum hederae CBS 113979]